MRPATDLQTNALMSRAEILGRDAVDREAVDTYLLKVDDRITQEFPNKQLDPEKHVDRSEIRRRLNEVQENAEAKQLSGKVSSNVHSPAQWLLRLLPVAKD